MTIENFTVRDIADTSVAFPLLALFLVVPGYVVGAVLDVLGFARRSLLARLAIAIGLSVAVVPILLFLNGRYLPAAPWALCAVAWVAFPVLLVRRAHWLNTTRGPLSKERKCVLAIVAGWIVVGTLCLVDLQIGHRLYFNVAAFDYTLRTAFTAAIQRTGIPPTNPYFHPGHSYVLRYHYFWYMVCGLSGRMGGSIVTPRIAVIAGTLWSGVALVAVVCLYMQFFGKETTGHRDKRMLIGVALLGVTGLDIVPDALLFLLTKRFNASSDWWNELVISWVNSVFWQAHSTAALVACATGLLVAWTGAQRPERWARLASAAVCGAAFASGFGLSIYVTFVFGIFLAVWVIILFLRGCRRAAGVHCIAGMLALVLALPYLLTLSGDLPAHGKWPIEFTVRSFYFAEALVSTSWPGPHWHVVLANLLALPLNYFLEFGFFFVVGVKQWERIRKCGTLTDEDAFGVVMLAISLLMSSFFRSTTIANNDLGWRAIILAQFVLLIWAPDLWENGLFPAGRRWRSAVGVMVMLGAAGAVYDLTMMRLYPILSDTLSGKFAVPRFFWLAPDHQVGERTYAMRQTYEELKGRLPKLAIVQQNPNARPSDLFFGLYADRQTDADSPSCSADFGGPAALCPPLRASINELFSAAAHLSYAQVEDTCRRLSIDALVVKDTDGVWGDKGSWIWSAKPAIDNDHSRVFLCGARAGE